VLIDEGKNELIYDAHKEFQYTFLLDQYGYIELVYEQAEMWDMFMDIKIEATIESTSAGDQTNLRIFGGLCNDN
jgi:hypothetical protein